MKFGATSSRRPLVKGVFDLVLGKGNDGSIGAEILESGGELSEGLEMGIHCHKERVERTKFTDKDKGSEDRSRQPLKTCFIEVGACTYPAGYRKSRFCSVLIPWCAYTNIIILLL